MKRNPDWNRKFDEKRSYPVLLDKSKGGWIQFGLLSDTHLTSNYCDEDALRAYYSDLNRQGIRNIFHAGDIWDGCTGYTQIYEGQMHNVDPLGFDNGVDYVSGRYPKRNMKTYFILGNHDARCLEREGTDFGKALSKEREDLVYLQPYYARLLLSNDPRLTLDLVHVASHVAYTKGYNLQRYLRNVPPSQRADMLALGHTHSHEHVSVEGDDESFLTGGWQRANEYSIRRGTGSDIGGWRVRVKLATNSPNPMDKVEATWMRY